MQKIASRDNRTRISHSQSAFAAPSTCKSALSISIALALVSMAGQVNAQTAADAQGTSPISIARAQVAMTAQKNQAAITKANVAEHEWTEARKQTIQIVQQAAQANAKAHADVEKAQEALLTIRAKNAWAILNAIKRLPVSDQAIAWDRVLLGSITTSDQV
ncbi:hypothetical protein, partial [Pandoraea sp. CB10b_02]|uniref:hypothetical protein n=1 Tax=Pandoraea sp. CB10b_02 TaxID=2014535 RepID=UPI00257F292A